MTEFARKELRGAKLIANPGCYPTSILVPMILARGGANNPALKIVDTMPKAPGLTESVLLSLAGCVCGLLLAMIGLDVLKQVIAELVSGAREIAIDFRVHGRRAVVHFGDAAGVLRSGVACDEGGSKIVLDDERQVERPAVND